MVPGYRHSWQPALTGMPSTRCRRPATGSGTQRRARKYDSLDAHVPAEIVRLDRAHHRLLAGDSADVERLELVARAHQSMIWDCQRRTMRLRSILLEYFPASLEAFHSVNIALDDPDALVF